MTMPDLFEQLDSPAENGDDWIRRLLSEPDETPSPTPADCTGLAKAAKQARTLVDAGSDDYDKLTSAQQTLTKSISACTANMTVDQIDRLFPQDGPSVTIPDTGKEAQ